MTILTSSQIMKLIAKAEGAEPKRASTKEAAIRRFNKTMAAQFGLDFFAAEKILNAGSYDLALNALGLAADPDCGIEEEYNEAEEEKLLQRGQEALGEYAHSDKAAVPKAKGGKRRGSLAGKAFQLAAGATNPYRENTLSHAAFELVRDNAGITFEGFVEKGGRVRTLQEDVKAGRVIEVKKLITDPEAF
jgi:hypothetical protein